MNESADERPSISKSTMTPVHLRSGPAVRDVHHYPGVNAGEYASRRE